MLLLQEESKFYVLSFFLYIKKRHLFASEKTFQKRERTPLSLLRKSTPAIYHQENLYKPISSYMENKLSYIIPRSENL